MPEKWQARVMTNPDHDVASGVVAAVEALLTADRDLLILDASERAITHLLACHLADRFPRWDVDCEYNRDRHCRKVLRSLPDLPPGRDEREVYPDVIVHHRNTDENLLVIEVKKTSNHSSDKYDLAKLEAYKVDLGYTHALFMRLQTGAAEPAVAKVSWCAELEEPRNIAVPRTGCSR